MKRILDLASKDVRQILRDKMTFLFLLIMPVMFTLLFSFAFGGPAKGGAASAPAVGLVDQDRSELSLRLKGMLQSSASLRIVETEGSEPAVLDRQVADGSLSAAVIVPAGYAASLKSGSPLRLSVVADPARSESVAAREAILQAASRMASAAQVAQIAHNATGADVNSTLAQAVNAWEQPPVGLAVTSAAVTTKPDNGQVGGVLSPSQTSPGMMVQFALAGLITAAQVLVGERKSRCLQRLLTTSVARHEILIGHFLAMFAVIFCQFILLVGFGQIFLRLDYLSQPAATLTMITSTALFVAALGLLIGALAKSDEQVILFALIPMFLFSGLGGAWMPLELTGKTFQVIGHVTPVAWAMDGFKNIVARGLGLASIWLPAAALLGYAALFFSLAVWKFKFE